jgi:alpha-1,3-mannosyltransferase
LIVEGRSDDGTYAILKLLRAEVEGIGRRYFNSSNINPTTGERTTVLAELRNQALEPLTKNPGQYSPNTTILFMNDVSICMKDMVEMIHQRLYQNAEIACDMNWTYIGPDTTFYDVWIGRGKNNDSFLE